MGDPQCSRIGELQNDYSRWGQLLEISVESAGKDCGLLLLGGDLVNRGDSEEEWEAFFEAGGRYLREMKVVSPAGNHGRMGEENSFFSFDYGCCHLMVLDSGYMGTRKAGAVEILRRWIDEDLSGSNRPVSFVLLHHPFVTVGTSFDDDIIGETMRNNYLDLFREHGVDFILCGHQHLYCRTRNLNEDESSLIQIMGVSGTKYFDGQQLDKMEAVKEFESVATIFRTDGNTVKLETIDCRGNVVDFFAKAVNPKLSPAVNTKPDREFDIEAFLEKVKPDFSNGIRIFGKGVRKEMTISSDVMRQLSGRSAEYSVMRRGTLKNERHNGVLLLDLLAMAGWNGSAKTMIMTNSQGFVNGLCLDEILEGGAYGPDGTLSGTVPAIITVDRQLICGQQQSREYNGRMWIKDIREIELK